MSRILDQQRILSRRAMVLGGIQLLAGTALMSRLFYLQFVRGDEYTLDAEGNRINVRLLIPPRGNIVDMRGDILASNDVNYRLMLDCEDIKQAHATWARAAALLSIETARGDVIASRIPKRARLQPMMAIQHLRWEDVAKLEFHLPELPGLSIEEGQWRNYALGMGAAHLLGYVGKVAQKDMNRSNPLHRLPEMRIGKSGVEAAFEARLQGVAGTRETEVNVRGVPVRQLREREPQEGEALPLHVHGTLQAFCAEQLRGHSGSIVVLDAHSGAVRAMTSMPAFDPNSFSKGIAQTEWDGLLADEKNPLLNKAIAGQYPPASTFKMITGIAALKHGVSNPQRSVHCPGHFFLGNHRFNCWKPEGHGRVNMEQALAVSCDTYFYTIARELGMDRLAEVAREFGLGEATGLDVAGEKSGLMPTPAWKERVRGTAWNQGETINASIGQGDVLATPLQLAVMTARLVNGGKKITPKIVQSADDASDSTPYIDMDPAHFAPIMRGMDMVTGSPMGTAYWVARQVPEHLFGGKTGTAQVRRITVRGQDQSSIPWRYRHHALFVGYAPKESPRYVCAVVVEHGGGGSATAAPIARDVLQKTVTLLEREAT
jgi:penicillin-binding protein 2